MAWQTAVQLQLGTIHNGRLMVVAVDTKSLMVIALETHAPDLNSEVDEKVAAVLDQHAHTIVGRGKTLALAMVMAENFAQQWENGTPLAQCKCAEVLPP